MPTVAGRREQGCDWGQRALGFQRTYWKVSSSLTYAQVFAMFHLQKKLKPGFCKQLLAHRFPGDLAKKC